MKLLNMLSVIGGMFGTGSPRYDRAVKTPERPRTPEEVKARRKAYRKRKAAKAARRRNRR